MLPLHAEHVVNASGSINMGTSLYLYALYVRAVMTFVMCPGMQYLHHGGVLHGDLKPGNVLLKSTATDARGFICKVDLNQGPAHDNINYMLHFKNLFISVGGLRGIIMSPHFPWVPQ